MPTLINFDARELGGTESIKMQGSLDGQATWTDATPYIALTNHIKHVTDSDHLAIDTGVFIPGNIYPFRLIDQDGITVSNIINCMVPYTGVLRTAGDDDLQTAGGDTIIFE
jgi:hypothetical protein